MDKKKLIILISGVIFFILCIILIVFLFLNKGEEVKPEKEDDSKTEELAQKDFEKELEYTQKIFKEDSPSDEVIDNLIEETENKEVDKSNKDKEVTEVEKVDNSKNTVVYNKETNMTTVTDSTGFSFTSSTSKKDSLPKDENGEVIVSVDMKTSPKIKQTDAVKLENSLTPILKEVLRNGEDYKTNFEGENLESIYVHSKDYDAAVYSVIKYSNEADAVESAKNSGSKYVLGTIYSINRDDFKTEAQIEFHINNLIKFGIADKDMDKEKLKKFVLDANTKTSWGEEAVNKENSLYGTVVLNEFIDIGKIIKIIN